jgi:hypothetical protein
MTENQAAEHDETHGIPNREMAVDYALVGACGGSGQRSDNTSLLGPVPTCATSLLITWLPRRVRRLSRTFTSQSSRELAGKKTAGEQA